MPVMFGPFHEPEPPMPPTDVRTAVERSEAFAGWFAVYADDLAAYRERFADDLARHCKLSNAERVALGLKPLK